MSSIPELRGGGAIPRLTLQGLRSGVATLLAATLAIGVAAACSPQDSATATPVPSPSASESPGPKPTSWPTTTVEASIALGAAHTEFTTMLDDLAAAIDAEDPARIDAALGAALEFLTGNQTNIPRLQAYGATKSVGDRLAVVYEQMIQGATEAREGLRSGDGAAVERGLTAFFTGSTDYVSVSPDLVAVAEQALFMKRQLLR